MKRILQIATGVLALALVPCLLYVAITRLGGAQTALFSFWAPIVVLAADALLFFIALGAWPLRAWDRAGLAVTLPLLIAMASWGSMMGMVEAQRAHHQAMMGTVPAPPAPAASPGAQR